MPEDETEHEESLSPARSKNVARVWKRTTAFVAAGILIALLIPTLGRLREAARLSNCGDNLKRLSLACKMYANEHRGVFPPLSRVPGNFVPAWESVYPDYLDDPSIVTCPSDVTVPSGLDLETSRNEEVPIWDDHSYVYFGYAITSEEAGLSFLDTYEQKVTEALRTGNLAINEQLGKWLLPESFWEDSLYVGENKGTEKGDHLLRLVEDVNRFNIDQFTMLNPRPPHVPLIVMFDRPGAAAADFHHTPGGSNVLFRDGHVEFSTYASDEFCLSPLFIEKFLQTEARIEELYSNFVRAQKK